MGSQSILSEGRLDAFLQELDGIHWDVIILVETWREESYEEFKVESEHFWCGSGGTRGSCGVGFLVHKQHRKHTFTPVSNRFAILEVKLPIGTCRIFGIYFPDTSRPDNEVDQMYTLLEAHVHQARRRHVHCMLAGDFNAQVGSFTDFDDSRIIG